MLEEECDSSKQQHTTAKKPNIKIIAQKVNEM